MCTHLKISVITPTYNRGDFIQKTLGSLASQTYHNFEHIVVDGGSTDNTSEVLKIYQLKYDLKYISRQDKGMYYAINDGIKMASGDIIAYLNSDDLYFPWTLNRVVQEFIEDDKLDMVYGDSMVYDLLKKTYYLNIYASHRKYWLPTGGVLCQPTVFLHRRVFDKIGYFNTNYKYLGDCEFWLRVDNDCDLSIVKIDEIIAIECNHGNTFRQSKKIEILEEKKRLKFLYTDKQCALVLMILLQVLSYINKELKIYKFIIRNCFNNSLAVGAWCNFLNNYRVSFNIKNYILCKIFHNRARFPRFSIDKR